MGHRERVEAIFAEERARRAAFLEVATPEVRAWMPYDATPTTRGIGLLAEAVGIAGEIGAIASAHAANPAVLHGRVFGRGARMEEGTIQAAFTAGAQVRAAQLTRLAEAVDGLPLRREVELSFTAAGDDLGAVFGAQEQALLLCAARLDAIG